MRPVLLILLGLCCGVNGLKCRSQEGATDGELKRIVRSCMQRSGSSGNNNGGNNQDQDNERYYGNQRYNFDSSYNGQERGQGQGQQRQQQQSYDNRWRRSSKQSDSNNNNNNNKGNNTSEMGPCVAQCFFEEMNMVGSKLKFNLQLPLILSLP